MYWSSCFEKRLPIIAYRCGLVQSSLRWTTNLLPHDACRVTLHKKAFFRIHHPLSTVLRRHCSQCYSHFVAWKQRPRVSMVSSKEARTWHQHSSRVDLDDQRARAQVTSAAPGSCHLEPLFVLRAEKGQRHGITAHLAGRRWTLNLRLTPRPHRLLPLCCGATAQQ